MASKKIQLYTDRDKTIEASPETSANCVILSDGNDLQKVLDNDLTNPTVVHEETSFKVGVGDIDVSSSVVDGEVGRMVIKGKTYQNILPEPSTHVLSNNKQMFKVNEGLDSNVEIVDAVSKSAILKGQTLVNLVKKLTTQNIGYGKDWTVQGGGSPTWSYDAEKGITATNTINGSMVLDYNDLSLFKPNTIYTLFVDVKWNGISRPPLFSGVTTKEIPLNNGLNIVKFTTVSDLTVQYMCFRLGYAGTLVSGCEYTFNNIMALEGDYTNIDIPYFTGMQSVKLPVLTTTGKNLFDGKLEKGSIYTSTGQNANAEALRSDYIKVEPNTSFIITNNFSYSSLIYLYDDNKNYIKSLGDKKNVPFTIPSNCRYIRFRSNIDEVDFDVKYQLEQGTQSTSYEPYKSNILSTTEEVVLKSIGGVKDTLNCNTGEYVERIKEVVFNGSSSENWYLSGTLPTDTSFTRFDINGQFVNGVQFGRNKVLVCDKLPYVFIHDLSGGSAAVAQECIANHSVDDNKINLVIKKERLTEVSVTGLKQWLQSNPITVQYELVTPVVKTVDLSTSGNWEKVVLDGRQGAVWQEGSINAFYVRENRLKKLQNYSQAIISDTGSVVNHYGSFVDGCNEVQITGYLDTQNKYPNENWLYIRVPNIKSDVNALKQYLSQNPITVWYQTTTHKDSTQVKQPIFFKDGHIQLSSGAENSLVPTLDYQAKTSNSYVMDLMKANTRYTMKAKTASGTFTIDGASYNAGTNGTFTSPSSMTNKLLIMSNKANKEVMIIEGDVTDKAIPHFKGIKSAFEGEDKIEVLSTGKNLVDNAIFGNKDDSGYYSRNNERFAITLKPNTTYICSYKARSEDVINDLVWTIRIDNTGGGLVGGKIVSSHDKNIEFTFTTNSNANYLLSISPNNGDDTGRHYFKDFILAEQGGASLYEPYKSNSTKIPLLSPLRSLPNGVCDELIVDRMKKKATLIQRVGEQMYDGSNNENWFNGYGGATGNRNKFEVNLPYISKAEPLYSYSNHFICERTSAVPNNDWAYRAYANGSILYFLFSPDVRTVELHNVDKWKKWLQANPLTVSYPLATPIITEIDLEGFPYIYKDGHIFLNSEIAPVVEINYNINQSQQIQSNNETLQRHELDILDLDNLIVSFVNAEYNLRLLKFNMELSMMALAE